jgi:hypothetical protein
MSKTDEFGDRPRSNVPKARGHCAPALKRKKKSQALIGRASTKDEIAHPDSRRAASAALLVFA